MATPFPVFAILLVRKKYTNRAVAALCLSGGENTCAPALPQNFISIDPNGHFESLLCSLQFFPPASPTTLILSAGQWFPPNKAF